MATESQLRNVHARRLFDAISDSYEWPAQLLSFFQYGLWHRFLTSRLRLSPDDAVLDVCTGTGMVATRITESTGCSVVGVDLSERMIREARRKLQTRSESSSVRLLTGRAEDLPFADNSFDAVVFTFLLRYVEEPRATLTELSRALRPGGQMASLDFYVPHSALSHTLWLAYTRLVLPLATRLITPGWRAVGSFLGPSISAFYRDNTLQDLSEMWETAGMIDIRTRVLSMGGAVVMWGTKEAEVEC